jgi:hypothetical protein
MLAHKRGDGNSNVAEYNDNATRNNLYAKWKKVKNPSQAEIEMLKKYKPAWNIIAAPGTAAAAAAAAAAATAATAATAAAAAANQ